MKIGFHGTSVLSATKILREGWKPPTKHWTVSTGKPYVMHNDSDNDSAFKLAFQQAMTAAFRDATIYNYRDVRRAVIAFDISDKVIETDRNHNADDAYQILDDIKVEDILGIWVDVHDLSALKLVFATSVVCKTLAAFNINDLELNDLEKKIVRGQCVILDPVTVPIAEIYKVERCNWYASELITTI